MADPAIRLLTVAEAAVELGVSHRRVQQLIDSGRLSAEWLGKQRVIRPADLDAVRHRKPGRPPKEKPKPTKAKARATGRKVKAGGRS